MPFVTGGGGGSGTSTRIFAQTLAGSQATFDITAIPATYSHLQLIYALIDDDPVAGGISRVLMRFNNDSGANYDYEEMGANSSAGAIAATAGATSMRAGLAAGANATAGVAGMGTILIPYYSNTTLHKGMIATDGVVALEGTVADYFTQQIMGQWRNAAAINEITLLPAAGTTFLTGSRVSLYGIV